MDGDASHPVVVVGGGIAYTRLPCPASDHQCLRIDRLSADVLASNSELALGLYLQQPSVLLPLSASGHFEVPAGGLRFGVRYEHNGEQTLVMADNHEAVQGHVDVLDGMLGLGGITAASGDGSMLAQLSLFAVLENTQPTTTIIQEPGAAWNQVSLTASSFDAEQDPLEHHWMIPGVGVWEGDHITVELPVGRHPVIVRVDDIHHSSSVDAIWVEIEPGLPSP